eukprot:CAMPEP_0194048658 /NCGR_PEP_ID=MMETSP0009_2-20130614/28054_1 /TAXON_ID=210454 /ORGANISM="Grammatophora oceanica, Strain CCMP 410" /LENGTH=228 /DNA_ID=CAMNT_0038694589 /DNA_START=56 /DNA_END=742 /DNA_ORIENTATION=+
MGNSAGKQIDEAELVAGNLDPGAAIAKTFVSTEKVTKIKSQKKTWVDYGGESEKLLWSYKHVGMFKKHTFVSDSAGTEVALMFCFKKGMTSATNCVCKLEACYDGQEALTEEELKKAGIEAAEGKSYFPFAKIETSRTMTTAKCSYELVTGKDEFKPLYSGEKLASMGFRALFKQGDTLVAKAYMPGMSMSPHLDTAAGVDMLAVVSIGYALAGDESSAGALAGAGVI